MSSRAIKKNVAKRQDAIDILAICKTIYEMPDWAWPTEGPRLREKIEALLYPDKAKKPSGELITTLKG